MATIDHIPAELIRLTDLPPQVCGIVRSIDTDDEEIRHLKALGVCSGRRVERVRGGDPLIIKVFGSLLGLSAAIATHVRVETCAPANCGLRESGSE